MQTIPTIVNVHTGGFSEFGWDSLVAIATGALAFITALLAWSTRALARETSEDVRSEIRPVLIDAGRGKLTARYETEATGFVQVFVKNVGPGPAINAQAKASLAEALEGGTRPIDQSLWQRVGTVGPGQPGSADIFVALDVPGDYDRTLAFEIECVYEDLAGGLHRTTLAYSGPYSPRELDADHGRTFDLSLVATRVKTIKGPPRQTRKQRRAASAEAERYRRAIA